MTERQFEPSRPRAGDAPRAASPAVRAVVDRPASSRTPIHHRSPSAAARAGSTTWIAGLDAVGSVVG